MGLLMDRVPNGRFAVAACAFAAALSSIGSLPRANAAPAAAPASTAASIPASPGAAEKLKPAVLQDALRSAVAATRAKLGTLQPWQQLLFTGEVLPHAENFVREFRPQGAGYKVDVDEAMLRNYLAFFGPRMLGTDQPQFLARVEADPSCTPCQEALPSLHRLLESRLSSRGVRLARVKDGELPSKSTLQKTTAEFPSLALVQALVSTRGAQGAVVMRFERATQKDDESGLELHKEDRKLRLTLGISAGNIAELRSLEFQATDSTEQSSRRLVLEAMSGVGAKFLEQSMREATKSEGRSIPEVLVRVAGLHDYYELNQLKSQIQLALGELNPVVERRLAKGRVVLAVRTRISGAELRKKLHGVALGGSQLMIRDVLEGESGIELEAEIQ
jgi:hypothetical protein